MATAVNGREGLWAFGHSVSQSVGRSVKHFGACPQLYLYVALVLTFLKGCLWAWKVLVGQYIWPIEELVG